MPTVSENVIAINNDNNDIDIEEDESEYSYVYETDSEYEYYDEEEEEDSAEQEVEVVSNTICIKKDLHNNDEESEGIESHRKQLEKFKPKLPDYITTEEPCAFSEDPGKWIAWMENEVNKEKQRRLEAMTEENEEEITQEHCEEGIADNQLSDCASDGECDGDQDMCERNDIPAILESEGFQSEKIEDDNNHDDEDFNMDHEDCDEESEWEYETDYEDEESPDNDKQIEIVSKQPDEAHNYDSSQFENDDAKSKGDGKGEGDEKDFSSSLETKCYGKQLSEPADFGSEISHRKLDDEQEIPTITTEHIIENRDETPWDRENSSKESDTQQNDGSSVLDMETQKKLEFVRRKRAEAASKRMSTIGVEDDIVERLDAVKKVDPSDILDEDVQRKLNFIRMNKKNSSPMPLSKTNSSNEVVNPPQVLKRQQSNPEGRKERPDSIFNMGNDSNLDDMLARIKTLRAERKQILQDMSAIKNAFEVNSTKTKEEGAGHDDGFVDQSTGNCTPIHEVNAPFKSDSNGDIGPNNPPIGNRRQSFDSGIGCKSISSVQDGPSPTKDLEGDSSSHSRKKKRSSGKESKRKKNKEIIEREGDVLCFICGENLGKLTKGAIMHMGLRDGDPICSDALYLTDESKEKIMSIASTKMFSFEQKYEMLETLELETWDLDYDMPSGDMVDTFLQDIEEQKKLDEERFISMRSDAIQDILNEEFKDLLSQHEPTLTQDHEFKSEESTEENDCDIPPPPIPPLPLNYSLEDAEPDSPPLYNIPPAPPALSNILASIKNGIPNLRHTETQNSSELPMGKVIHKHIAPRVFTKEVRRFVNDISKDDHKKRLRKVATNDKSSPFIPDDVEIYFYGNPNSDRTAPPPPVSKLKEDPEDWTSSKKRGNPDLELRVPPIHSAARDGDLATLQELTEFGEEDDLLCSVSSCGKTPLHFAAQMGHLECLQWMIQEHGLDVNQKDEDDATALHYAAATGHADTVRWLLKNGATQTQDNCGKSPMNDATENEQIEILSVLVQFIGQLSPNTTTFSKTTKTKSPAPVFTKDDALSTTEPAVTPSHVGPGPPPPPPPPPPPAPPAPSCFTKRESNLSRLNQSDEDGSSLKPSDLMKNRKRKVVSPTESSSSSEGSKTFVPPKFSVRRGPGDSLIKPSEYLKSLQKCESLPDGPPGIPNFGQQLLMNTDTTDHEPRIEPSQHQVSENTPSPSSCNVPTPPPPPPPGPNAPPPPPPPPPSSVRASKSLPSPQSKDEDVAPKTRHNPQAAMAISMKDLQSVNLKKTEAEGIKGKKNDQIAKYLLPTTKKSFDGNTKGDLISELKMSHKAGGVGRLRLEQMKAQEEIEKEQYRKFLNQFTPENFIKKIPEYDPAGNEIALWKREILAKKAAEKAKQEALEERARLEEERKQTAVPAWKKQLIEQKEKDAKRVQKQKLEREKERKKKLILKL